MNFRRVLEGRTPLSRRIPLSQTRRHRNDRKQGRDQGRRKNRAALLYYLARHDREGAWRGRARPLADRERPCTGCSTCRSRTIYPVSEKDTAPKTWPSSVTQAQPGSSSEMDHLQREGFGMAPDNACSVSGATTLLSTYTDRTCTAPRPARRCSRPAPSTTP